MWGRVEPAPDVEALFRTDGRWLGGDGAGSVLLPDGRRLWLFGDSFVARHEGASRAEATLVNNTVGISRDGDALVFRWRIGVDGAPHPFLDDPEPDTWIWPGHAVVIDGTLLVFLMRIRPQPEPGRIPALTNFAVAGWGAVLVRDTSGDPLDWEIASVEVPPTPQALLVGSGGVLVHDGHVYAHTVPVRHRRRGHHLVRWKVADAHAGDLADPQWWTGRRGGWQKAPTSPPVRVAAPSLTEFTVHHDPGSGTFVRVELVRLRRPQLRLRSAVRPEGPWSRPRTVYRPPQADGDEVFCYAAKAHPHLGGPGLVVTYNSNTRDVMTLMERDDLYRPHALRVDLS